MADSLADLARLTGAPLDEVALAIAAELGNADVAGTRTRLDHLAAGVGAIGALEPQSRAEALLAAIGESAGFRLSQRREASCLMLDRVVEERSGHPFALAVVYSGVARRIGVALHPVGTESYLVLGDPETDPPVAIDPVPGGRQPPSSIRWLCPHLVAAMLLGAIASRRLEVGDLGGAIRALELRLVLPLAGPLRAHHERELIARRARCN